MRRRFSKDQWVKWLTEFEASGMSVTAYCRQIQVNQNSFYLWRRKLNASNVKRTAGSTGPLVEIKLAETDSIQFQFPGGVTADLPNRAESIRPLLQVLSELDSKS